MGLLWLEPPIKIARTLILHQSRSRRHWSSEIRLLFSALVRDGGVVSDHHSCNNYWLGNGTADRTATRRLRHSGSFAACSPRGL
jgi:hypothetical protein